MPVVIEHEHGPSAAEASDKRQNLNPPFIASHECGDLTLRILSPSWGTRYFDPAAQPPRKLTPSEARLVAARDTVKRRIFGVYEARHDWATGAYPDPKYIVRCWACRIAWLGRGGGMTCLTEADDGIPIGFDVCKECAANRELLKAKVCEALGDSASPARL